MTVRQKDDKQPPPSLLALVVVQLCQECQARQGKQGALPGREEGWCQGAGQRLGPGEVPGSRTKARTRNKLRYLTDPV